MAKIIGHWLTFGLLLFAAVPGGFLLGLEGEGAPVATPLIAVAIGTPALAALAVASALTSDFRASAWRAAALPLAVPPLVSALLRRRRAAKGR